MPKTFHIWIAALGLGMLPLAAPGQAIRLKAQASAEYRQDVRLGDIATVAAADPHQAEQLADTVVVMEIEKPVTLRAESLLAALLSQRSTGVIGNNLQISGAATCQIAVFAGRTSAMMPARADDATAAPTPFAASAPISPAPQTGAPSANAGHGAPLPASAPAPTGTLRDTITSRLMQDSSATRDELQIEVNSTNPMVDAPIAPTQRWLVRPLTRTLLGTVQFEAQLADGTKVLQRLTLDTEVKRLQHVLVTTAKVAHGDIITADKIRFEDQWLDRKLPTLFTSDKDVIGLEAQRDLDAGTQLDQRDFKPLLMAHKNDLISVLYVDGPLEIQLRGRALKDAKYRDAIEVRNESTNETYTALMIKKNLGVVGVLTPAEENALREAP